jgi:hypothetical protein
MACSGVRAPGCRPCAHGPLVTRPAGGGPPTQGRDLRRAASGSRSAPRPSTATCGMRSSCSRRFCRPWPSRSRSRAEKPPLHGRTQQPPSTSWVTSSSTFTSATETSRDAQLIHIREEGVHRAAGAADETVTVWSHTGHITVRGKACLLIVSTLFAPQPSVAFRPARPMGAADMLSHVR